VEPRLHTPYTPKNYGIGSTNIQQYRLYLTNPSGLFTPPLQCSVTHAQPIYNTPNSSPTGYESDHLVVPPGAWADVTDDFKTFVDKEALSTYVAEPVDTQSQSVELGGPIRRIFSASMVSLATGVAYALKNGTVSLTYDASLNQIKVNSELSPVEISFVYKTDSGTMSKAQVDYNKPPGVTVEPVGFPQTYNIPLPITTSGTGVLHDLCFTLTYDDTGSLASDRLMGERKALVQPIPVALHEALRRHQASKSNEKQLVLAGR
jgi:hypothetical protein